VDDFAARLGISRILGIKLQTGERGIIWLRIPEGLFISTFFILNSILYVELPVVDNYVDLNPDYLNPRYSQGT
jgi:hypothetical protein